jgi:CO/xanthine dehydrogenase FAD-binding subunit
VSEVKYFHPRSYTELSKLLGQLPEGFQAVAGTTDFIPSIRRGAKYPSAILDVSRISEFKSIHKHGDTISIGSAVTMADIVSHDIIIKNCPSLASAAKSVGSVQTRNRATIGGNIANASPSADTAPVLLTLNADVHLVDKNGSIRRKPLADFYLDYKKTIRLDDEIITGFSFNTPVPGTWSRFVKVGQRSGSAISIANMSILLRRSGTICVDMAVAFGSVAPVPLRSRSVEIAAKGRAFDAALLAACAKAVQQDISPISDLRGSVEYRREVAANVLVRALTDAFA